MATYYTTLPKLLASLMFIVGLLFSLCSCTYLDGAKDQREYTRIQDAAPGQLNVKHMIDRETYYVHGMILDEEGRYRGIPKAIVAFSSKYQANEAVDTMHFEVAGTHIGMNLPQGSFDLLVFADIDSNGVLEPSEVVGKLLVELDEVSVPQKVLGQQDVQLTEPITIDWDVAIAVRDPPERPDSLFYPSGAIRNLDDPIFNDRFVDMGMYDPASFLELMSTGFCALAEDLGYKIPVVFVHGIAGSPREFETFIGRLDRSRYKPWFFYYPSGEDLDKLAELFYDIFLSGGLVKMQGMPMIIVAHSMGGLVVRDAINRYKGNENENEVHLFVTMATPFGGHAAAAAGEKHGETFELVLPSWRDLNPNSQFIGNLFRKPLPKFMHHELIYAYQVHPAAAEMAPNSDGVVTLASQRHPSVQRQAAGEIGFEYTHAGILDSKEVFTHISAKMAKVKAIHPPAQLRVFRQGGYDVSLGDEYTPVAQYLIHNLGKYLMALTKGTIETWHPEEEQFIAVVKGENPPRNDADRGWLRFLEEHPEFRDQ